jgi:hypothetical protein
MDRIRHTTAPAEAVKYLVFAKSPPSVFNNLRVRFGAKSRLFHSLAWSRLCLAVAEFSRDFAVALGDP